MVLLDSYGEPAVFKAIEVLFLMFAIPTFLFVKERPRSPEAGRPPTLRASARRLVEAWRRARTYEGVARFLVGRFLYTDAVNTLIGGFLTIYVIEELAFSDEQVQGLLAVAIVGAIIGGLGGGRLVDRYGPRRVLHGVLWTWVVAMGMGIAAGVATIGALAWPLGVLGGLALGATWAADRVYMQRISPPRYLGEFYGLYATVGRFATILGPLMWGIVVTVLGFPREAALGVLVGFIVLSRLVLEGVDDHDRSWTAEDRIAQQ
jgi:UMF1 family MFS transporter